MAEAQISRYQARPEDDPLVRHYMEQPDVMTYQLEVLRSHDAGLSHDVRSSHGAGPSHDATPLKDEETDDMDDPRFWTQLDTEDAKDGKGRV